MDGELQPGDMELTLKVEPPLRAGAATAILDSSSSVLVAGDYVTVNSPAVQIISISGSTMLVDKDIPAGGPGLPITYTAPVFNEFGEITS